MTDPDAGDMFENGNYRRRKRMKRNYRNSAYPKGLYTDPLGVHLSARNIFGHSPPAYASTPALHRYDPRYNLKQA